MAAMMIMTMVNSKPRMRQQTSVQERFSSEEVNRMITFCRDVVDIMKLLQALFCL